MSLVGIAKETLRIIEEGRYVGRDGTVDVRLPIDEAVRLTRLYDPETLTALVDGASAPTTSTDGARGMSVEVTNETTAAACRRLIGEGIEDVLALNFASAKNPGGGFVSGAKAQEEDLARCSALYACQLNAWGYYDANRAERSMLYTDHLIYSPRVPFFRDEGLELLPAPFVASVITSPAPNAGEVLRRDPAARPRILAALRTRGAHVLAVARAHAHGTLVLGAWGCGVFRNDPDDVAEMFASHLASRVFASAFDRVVFAVYDRSSAQANLRAFERRFQGAT
jgi:uncharacterized protein (TIGR02452 family)